MTSSINPAPHTTGIHSSKATLNANWAATKSEIEALQAGVPNPIFILATGQSNFTRAPALSWTPSGQAQVWNNTLGSDGSVGTAFTDLSDTTINLPQKIASEIAAATGRAVYLLNVSFAGQAISHWLSGASAPDVYDNISDNITAALAAAGVSKVDLFLWWQGESDTANSSYIANWETMIARFRAETWFPVETPIMLFGLAPASVSGDSGSDVVNNYLQKLSGSDSDRRRFIYNGALPSSYWTDTLHFSATGYSHAGVLAANEFLTGVGRSSILSITVNPVTGYVNIGGHGTADAPLTVNNNTAATVAPTTGTMLHLIAADSLNSIINLDVFGGLSAIVGRYANGTLASKTAAASANTLLQFSAQGWDTSAFVTGSAIQFRATETWSATARGGEVAIRATPNTTTSLADELVVNGTTGVAITNSAATALAVGRQGLTNPALQVDASASSVVTGIKITGAAAAGGVAVAAISSGSNENLTIDAKGSGTVTINGTGSGVIALGQNTTVAGTATITSNNANALAVGRQGATNPVLQVDASTASVATGLKIKGAAAAAGLALSVITSGTNENLTIDAAGSGTVTINGTGTGAIALSRNTAVTGTGTITSSDANALTVGRQGATNPVLQIDASTASVATGLKVKGAAAASGLALSVITSGTNEPLTIDAAGSGAVTLGGTSTGEIRHARATNISVTAPSVATDALLVVNGNTAASVAMSNTPQIHMIGPDGSNAGFAVHAYGNAARVEIFQANGTQASKTATSAASGIFGFNGYGWDTSAYQIGAQFLFTPVETWSGSARGTRIRFLTNAAGTTTLSEKLRINDGGGVAIGSSFATDPGADNLLVSGAIASKVPTTYTGTSGTVSNTDSAAIFNPSGSFTVTLPTASSYTGRWLYMKTIAAQTVASASSNVIPRAGGAAGTAILAAAAGNWALLQSNGTNWEIMAGS